ncbi:hypothetical protein LAZ40_06315 [Cereibacter sphaeroides]|uniref:hypothetical protein n=1 Tax=Cereibacter sphaeroides TaxID=1063 RepID=UPI001F2438C6|nr:hypothetical protein [Cereibacter sphaeroides]MCE6958661.1 hypothetical protein [Cereibacter sphaeroides]MCE6973456.1 hypothetical protein [Cereibacter sphaeroides]
MTLRALWRGDLPLAHAFWSHGILYAGLASLIATVAAFGLIAGEAPAAVAAAVYFLPVPYILLTVVGVWRSAERYEGPPHWAQLARLVSLLWAVAMILV